MLLMIGLQAVMLEPESAAAKPILGLNPIFFWVIVALIFGGFGLYMFLRERERRKREFNRKYANNKVIADFTTEEGNAYTKMCVVKDGQIKTYLEKGQEVPLRELFVEKEGIAPLESYFVQSKYIYLIDWPFDAKPSHQVKIMRAYYKENDPYPKMRQGRDELSKKEEMEISARLAALSQEAGDMQVIIGEMKKAYETWGKILEQVKWVKWVLIAIGLDILIDMLNAVLTFMSSGKITSILQLVIKFANPGGTP